MRIARPPSVFPATGAAGHATVWNSDTNALVKANPN